MADSGGKLILGGFGDGEIEVKATRRGGTTYYTHDDRPRCATCYELIAAAREGEGGGE